MMMLLLAMALPQEFHEGFENLLEIVGKGDNMPIAGLIPIIIFFTWLALARPSATTGSSPKVARKRSSTRCTSSSVPGAPAT